MTNSATPADLRREHSVEDSVNGAGDGAIALLVVPLIGAALGALRGHLRCPPAATRQDHPEADPDSEAFKQTGHHRLQCLCAVAAGGSAAYDSDIS